MENVVIAVLVLAVGYMAVRLYKAKRNGARGSKDGAGYPTDQK